MTTKSSKKNNVVALVPARPLRITDDLEADLWENAVSAVMRREAPDQCNTAAYAIEEADKVLAAYQTRRNAR